MSLNFVNSSSGNDLRTIGDHTHIPARHHEQLDDVAHVHTPRIPELPWRQGSLLRAPGSTGVHRERCAPCGEHEEHVRDREFW